MKIRLFAVALVVTFFAPRAQAVTVEWNLMHSEYSDLSGWGVDPIWHVLGANFERHAYFEFWIFADSLQAGTLNNSPQNFSMWVREMAYGDVVDAESMLGDGLTYFYHTEKGLSGVDSDYGLSLHPNVYLAMCTEVEGEVPQYVYGWVELGWNGDGWNENGWPPGPEVLSSAWDLDGGPMIVGGGSAQTPEPSSALLLLVGGALLALRRDARFGARPSRAARDVLS